MDVVHCSTDPRVECSVVTMSTWAYVDEAAKRPADEVHGPGLWPAQRRGVSVGTDAHHEVSPDDAAEHAARQRPRRGRARERRCAARGIVLSHGETADPTRVTEGPRGSGHVRASSWRKQSPSSAR